MKRWALLCGVMLMFAGIASAQDEAPKAEVFGGYSFIHGSYFGQGYNFNGGGGSFSYNPNHWLGLVGDFGGDHWSGSGVDANVITYLFGPKITYRADKFTPFAQVLFGGARVSGSVLTCPSARVRPQTVCESTGSENAFAMTFGGGLDYNVTPHIGIRLAQAEYLMTRFNGLGSSGGDTQNNVRFETGVVFRW